MADGDPFNVVFNQIFLKYLMLDMDKSNSLKRLDGTAKKASSLRSYDQVVHDIRTSGLISLG